MSVTDPIADMLTRIRNALAAGHTTWVYEPRTFPLEWDAQGNITEAFSPDFYLPEQDLYIELTTLRPQLSTRKNRKMRKMKELYPQVNVKLFKRADLRNLMVKYGLAQQAEKFSGTDAQKSDL